MFFYVDIEFFLFCLIEVAFVAQHRRHHLCSVAAYADGFEGRKIL